MTFALVLATAFAVSAALPARASAGIGAPAIWSESPDYAPGDTVTLRGDGWGIGEVVHINVNDDAGQTWSRDVDVTADFFGNVTDEFTLPNWFVALYTVTATAPSGTATATFTDGNVKARTNASGFTFRLDWTRHNGTSSQPQPDCNAPANRQATGFSPAVGFSGGAQFSDGVPSDSSEVLKAADLASNNFVFIGWTGETPGDTFQARTDPHEICVTGNFTGSRTYVANYQANVPPTVAANNATRTVNEGQTATNSGTFGDANALDTVSLSASVGTLTQTGTHSGTWSWSFGTTDGPDDSQTVTITATDNHGATSTTTFSLTVNNVAPTVAFTSAPASANEGQTKTYMYSISDPGVDTVQSVSTSCGLNGTKSNASNTNTSGSFDCTFPDGPGSSTVSAQATDSDGSAGNIATQVVAIANVAPVVTLSGAASVNEGSTHSYSYTVSDPGDEVFSRDAQSCGANGTLSNAAFNSTTGAGSFDCSFPDGPASSSVSVTVSDGDGGSDSDSITVTISNVAPTVSLSGANAADEGDTKSYSYTVSDPGDEVFALDSASCGAGNTLANSAFNPATGAGSFDCTFPDGPNSSSVSVTVSDGDGGSDSDSITVTIANVAPVVSLSGAASVNEGSTHTYSFTVTDPGQDTFSVVTGYPSCGTGGSYVTGSLSTNASGGSFQCSFPDGPATTHVAIKVEDSDGASDTDSEDVVIVAVANVDPVVTLNGPASANEGDTKSYSFTTFDQGTETFALDSASCGAGNTLSNQAFNPATGAGSFDCAFADGLSNLSVSVTVSDGDGGSGSDSISVTVANVAPTVSLSGPTSVASGSTHAYTFTISDPGEDTQTYAVGYPTCGDNGTVSAPAINNAGGSFNCTFGIGPATSTVAVKANDGEDDSNEDSKLVTIAPPNHPPTVDAGPSRSGTEGSAIALDGTVSDPDGDSYTVVWTYTAGAGVDAGATCSFGDATAVDTTIACTDDGTYTATLTATDSKGASSSDETTVTVSNANPVVTPTNETPPPYAMATTVVVGANFSDAGTNDTHRTPPGGNCTISWDDGTPSSTGVVAESNGSGSCSASHVYSGPGVYTVTITVTDDDGGSGSATAQVVVYDPSAGFVTGGGWINVAPGSYPAGPALSGRANFGFTSKYKKGASIPTGETEFNFQVADFRFHSSNYQWLVVSGYKAQYKGTGEVNGAPGYDFRLTAYDGAIGGPGNTGQDKFRIKITEHSTGVVVFDNRLGRSDDMDGADPQAISGGSIVIHKA